MPALDTIIADDRLDRMRPAANIGVALRQQPQELAPLALDKPRKRSVIRMTQVRREQSLLDAFLLHVRLGKPTGRDRVPTLEVFDHPGAVLLTVAIHELKRAHARLLKP